MSPSTISHRLIATFGAVLIGSVALWAGPRASAQTLFIGDDAAEGASMGSSGTLTNYSSSSTTTFAFPTDGTTYKNTTNAVQQVKVSTVNFYSSGTTGTLTPFVAIYSGGQASTSIIVGAQYNVMLIGDALSVTGLVGVQSQSFTVNGGAPPAVNLAPGQTLVAGFVSSTAGIVKYLVGGSLDYIVLANTLPATTALPGALTGTGSTSSSFDNTMKFNMQITVTSPALIYVGDDADEGSSPVDGTGQYSLGSAVTYDSVRTGTTYINTTPFTERITPSQINYYASATGGTITPFLAVYSGDQTNTSIETRTDYSVLVIGDPITVAANASGPRQGQFLVGGLPPGEIDLYPNEVLTVGFMSSVAGVVRCGPTDATIDYVALSNTLPSTLPGPFASGTVTPLGQKLKFNVGLTVGAGDLYIGDDAAEGASMQAGNGNDNSPNPVTYDFVEPSTTWVNNSGSIELITLEHVNFFTTTQSGTITPFVSIYSGSLTPADIQNKAKYQVVMIGDPISVTSGPGAQTRAFQVNGDTPTFVLQPNQVLTAGYETTSGPVIQYSSASGGYIDHVDLGNTLPASTALPASFTGSSSLYLDRTLKFNVGFQVRTGNIKIACIGDSITYGSYTVNYATDAYPYRLQALLGTNFAVTDYGVPQTCMATDANAPYIYTTDYTASLAANPDLVIIQLGTNDSKPQNLGTGGAETPSDYENSYLAMIKTYRELHSVPAVIVNACPCVTVSGGMISDVVVANTVVPADHEVAGLAECQLIDVFSNTSKFLVNVESVDGVHPYTNGQRGLANTVFTALNGPQSLVAGINYEILNESSGKLVEIAGASTASGANLDIATEPTSGAGIPATLATNQEWVLTQISGNIYKITNLNSGLVMDAGTSTTSGSTIVQTAYTGAASQQWQMVNAPELGFLKIVNVHSGLALDVTGGRAADGTVPQQVTGETTDLQQNFQFIPK